MTIIFLRTKGNSWLNADKIECIDAEGYAYAAGAGRYLLIENWQNPRNQIILGKDGEIK